MNHRIQGDPSEVSGSRIAERVGRPGMGRLVDAQRQKQNQKLEDDEKDFAVHESLPEYALLQGHCVNARRRRNNHRPPLKSKAVLALSHTGGGPNHVL
jgi:hypothetical protein